VAHNRAMPENDSKSGHTFADEVASKREKLTDHLQAAQALADEIGDGATAFLIATTLLQLNEQSWPKNLNRQE
jgi:hypothetical protein